MTVTVTITNDDCNHNHDTDDNDNDDGNDDDDKDNHDDSDHNAKTQCTCTTHPSFLDRLVLVVGRLLHDVMHNNPLLTAVRWHRQRKVGRPERHLPLLGMSCILLLLHPARSVGNELGLCQRCPSLKPVLNGCLHDIRGSTCHLLSWLCRRRGCNFPPHSACVEWIGVLEGHGKPGVHNTSGCRISVAQPCQLSMQA